MKKLFTLSLLCSSMLLSGQSAGDKITGLKSGGYTTKLDSIIFQDTIESHWVTTATYKFLYDGTGKVDTVYKTFEDGAAGVNKDELWTLKYGKNGLLSELKQEITKQDNTGKDYIYTNKKEVYEYNAMGKESTRTVFSDDAADILTPSAKFLTNYVPDTTTRIALDWDASTATWINSRTYLKTRQVVNGSVLRWDSAWSWNEAEQTYSLLYSTDYWYSGTVCTEAHVSRMNGDKFRQTDSKEYTHDDNWNRIGERDFHYDAPTCTSIITGSYKTSFKLDIEMSQTAFTPVNGFYTENCANKNAPFQSDFYEWKGTVSKLDHRATYYYSAFVADIVIPEDPVTAGSRTVAPGETIRALCYPIPATESVSIYAPVDNGTVKLSNSAGETVFSGIFSRTAQISVAGLPRGMYIVTIYSANAIQREMITVE